MLFYFFIKKVKTTKTVVADTFLPVLFIPNAFFKTFEFIILCCEKRIESRPVTLNCHHHHHHAILLKIVNKTGSLFPGLGLNNQVIGLTVKVTLRVCCQGPRLSRRAACARLGPTGQAQVSLTGLLSRLDGGW